MWLAICCGIRQASLYLAIDQVVVIKIKWPYLEADLIPKGTYNALPAVPDVDLPSVEVQATLVVRKDVVSGNS